MPVYSQLIPSLEDIKSAYPEFSLYSGHAVSVHGTGEDEGLRVACSLRNLEIILNEDYSAFVAKQVGKVLELNTFTSLCQSVKSACKDATLMRAIVLVHDLFKVSGVVNKFFPTGSSKSDHDDLLAEALATKWDEFPTLKTLDEKQKQILCLVLGKSLNLLQFVQAECNLDKLGMFYCLVYSDNLKKTS
jgi:hypothetical protein